MFRSKNMAIVIFFLASAACLCAQTPDWLWAVRAGGTQSDSPQLMTIDNQGNQYITGRFNGTTTFGITTLVSFGDYDIFIAKLDPNGNWLWVRQAGGTQADIGNGIAVDSAGNVYVTGGFVGTATFGTVTLSHIYIEHLFLSKLDTNGNWLWTVEALGEDNEAMGIAFDSEDNVYLTGAYRYTVIFGFLPQMTCIGLANVFVAKLDPGGHWLWAVQAMGVGWDVGVCMEVDSAGYIYLTGRFQNTAEFGSVELTSSGGYDAFIAKLDSNGNWLWAVRAGGAVDDIGWSLVLDGLSNVYVAGSFAGSASFGATTLASSGLSDVFLCKLDSRGNWLWVDSAGGTADDIAYGVALDSENNAYVTGQFGGTALFGPAALTSDGNTDVYIAKKDGNGEWNWLWAIRAGGSGLDAGYSIQVGSASNLYVMGVFSNTATFGSITLTSSGMLDLFTGKLEEDVGINEDIQVPSAVQIRNYPNPFNPETTLEYSVPVSGQASLKIYNLKGQLVRTLVDEVCAAGKHSAVWNGRDDRGKEVSSGVYLCRIDNGSRSGTRKMLLLK